MTYKAKRRSLFWNMYKTPKIFLNVKPDSARFYKVKYVGN
jgi:hypothetical protein